MAKGKGQHLLRQRLLAKLLAEDGGKTPLGRLMVKAGYSKSYAESPQKIKKTLSWKEMMDNLLPDNLLLQQHRAALTKKEFIAIGKKGEREILPTGEIDGIVVTRALDLAYKLKNKYPKGQQEGITVVVKTKND